MRPFKYSRASAATSAAQLLMTNRSAQFLAGGTNILDLMKEDVARPDQLVDIIVVLGAHAEKTRAEIKDLPLETVVNGTWSDGMASSIRAGMERLTAHDDTSALVVMLCDQPHVDAEVINKLVTAYRTTNAPLVTAKYNGTLGVPALFDRRLYPSLLALTGAQGAKSVILAHSAQLTEIPAPAAAFDVDTPADYKRLVKNC